MTITTPLDIPGCLGWLETDSDGTPQDQKRAHDGSPSSTWLIYPIDEQRGIVLLYERELSSEEIEALAAWRARVADPADQATDAEAMSAAEE